MESCELATTQTRQNAAEYQHKDTIKDKYRTIRRLEADIRGMRTSQRNGKPKGVKSTKKGQKKEEDFYRKDPDATPARNRSPSGLKNSDCA